MKTIILSAALLAIAVPAMAQNNCAPRPVVVDRLNTQYGETRQSRALQGTDTIVEVWASLETGTWTVTGMNPLGMTCVFAAGQGYEPITEDLPSAGDDI